MRRSFLHTVLLAASLGAVGGGFAGLWWALRPMSMSAAGGLSPKLQAAFDEFNRFRADRYGLPPLPWDDALAASAAVHATDQNRCKTTFDLGPCAHDYRQIAWDAGYPDLLNGLCCTAVPSVGGGTWSDGWRYARAVEQTCDYPQQTCDIKWIVGTAEFQPTAIGLGNKGQYWSFSVGNAEIPAQ